MALVSKIPNRATNHLADNNSITHYVLDNQPLQLCQVLVQILDIKVTKPTGNIHCHAIVKNLREKITYIFNTQANQITILLILPSLIFLLMITLQKDGTKLDFSNNPHFVDDSYIVTDFQNIKYHRNTTFCRKLKKFFTFGEKAVCTLVAVFYKNILFHK